MSREVVLARAFAEAEGGPGAVPNADDRRLARIAIEALAAASLGIDTVALIEQMSAVVDRTEKVIAVTQAADLEATGKRAPRSHAAAADGYDALRAILRLAPEEPT